jgi:hypothetical protein
MPGRKQVIAQLKENAVWKLKGADMKTVMGILLLFISTSLLAYPPECTQTPGSCREWNPSNPIGRTVNVPEPGTPVLIGLGLVVIAVTRRRKK